LILVFLSSFFPLPVEAQWFPKGDYFSPLTWRTKNTHRQLVKGLSTKSFLLLQSVFKQKSFLPLDWLTGRLSFQPERFGCPTGWKVSRPALFYDSEGKGKKSSRRG
jgi:hypothetical protein